MVLIAVQAAFIVIAVSTHTGVVSQQPYRKGLNYGERIELADKQRQRGWHETTKFDELKNQLTFQIKNKTGAPVRYLTVSGLLSRPAHKNEDLRLRFEKSGDGSYVAKLADGLAGAFVLDIKASQGTTETVVWRSRRRLWIKP